MSYGSGATQRQLLRSLGLGRLGDLWSIATTVADIGGKVYGGYTTYEQQRYPTLYNVIANLYGGTPGTTFIVPTVADTIILAGKTKKA